MINLSALELSKKIRAKEISAPEAAAAYIAEIKKKDGGINAFTTLSEEYALARAEDVQSLIDAGAELSPLAGVPIGIKDNISTIGIETTCASKILSGYNPVFDATVIEKINRAGMVIIGKMNMDEFAMGGSGETSAYGASRNPWDTERVAGGSSCGSAASVAAREIPLTLGSDTGGSIRQPCAFCGVTGIKPTYGSVSRWGLVAFASSLDQIGPIARDIDDSAALLSVISGPDDKDATCVIDKPFEFGYSEICGRLTTASTTGAYSNDGKTGVLSERLDGLKIGIPRNYFTDAVDDAVKKSVLAAADTLKGAGAEVSDFEMEMSDYAIHAYYIIACAEASSNLSRFDGLKYGYRSEKAASLAEVYRLSRDEGFGMEVKKRIMLGSFALSSGFYDAYYRKALQVRAAIVNAYNALFKRFDIILAPVAPTTAYKIGENIGDPMKMYMGDIFTVSVNIAGLPAAALPCGFDDKGLPVGFQLIGDAFAEDKIINAARVYQKLTDYHRRSPI